MIYVITIAATVLIAIIVGVVINTFGGDDEKYPIEFTSSEEAKAYVLANPDDIACVVRNGTLISMHYGNTCEVSE